MLRQPLARAHRHSVQGTGVGVVFHESGRTQRPGDPFRPGGAAPARQVGRIKQRAALTIQRTTGADARAQYAAPAVISSAMAHMRSIASACVAGVAIACRF